MASVTPADEPTLKQSTTPAMTPSEKILLTVRHILVPTDLTKDSLSAIRQAIHLGQYFGSRLTLLHVYLLPIAFEIPSGANIETELLKDQRQAEDALKEQGTFVRAAYPNCEWVFRTGGAVKSVADIALELRADLIVISANHHRWYNRFRQTEDADYIVHHSSCPVLMVTDSGDSLLNCPE